MWRWSIRPSGPEEGYPMRAFLYHSETLSDVSYQKSYTIILQENPLHVAEPQWWTHQGSLSESPRLAFSLPLSSSSAPLQGIACRSLHRTSIFQNKIHLQLESHTPHPLDLLQQGVQYHVGDVPTVLSWTTVTHSFIQRRTLGSRWTASRKRNMKECCY